ncbi:UNVERIFIED_CONTAM: hypothetical protein Slati_1243000 [Sesamum latifolium]|uniref:Uncharacterized protein n=1 Tax=Sesamum latifolium TaxID=2727402 RepID=A0AAW2XFK9_9LAMI
MKCLRTALLVIFLICVVPRQSHGSFLEIFRKLAEDHHNPKPTDQMSPSPSPVPATNFDSGNAQSHGKPTQEENCDKVNLPSTAGGSSSILLNVGNQDCVIQTGASLPQDFYTTYLTPINGMYLFFVAAIFFGGTWACLKVVKRRRHLDGVPYRELEMEQQESDPSFVVETPEGWDQNWDGDWDEEKAVKSPDEKHIGKVLENGASLKYINTTQWGSDWDD